MAMAKIWKRRLEAGTQKWEDCPDKYKDTVKALLKDDVKAGVITADEYQKITGDKYK